MKKILVTGGTTFVSKYVADYFVNHGYEVYVLNRNVFKRTFLKKAEGHILQKGEITGDFATE